MEPEKERGFNFVEGKIKITIDEQPVSSLILAGSFASNRGTRDCSFLLPSKSVRLISRSHGVVTAILLDHGPDLLRQVGVLAAKRCLHAFRTELAGVAVKATCVGEFHRWVACLNRLPLLMARERTNAYR